MEWTKVRFSLFLILVFGILGALSIRGRESAEDQQYLVKEHILLKTIFRLKSNQEKTFLYMEKDPFPVLQQ